MTKWGKFDAELAKLDELGIEYTVHQTEVKIGAIQYWPTTGTIMVHNRRVKARGFKAVVAYYREIK